MSTNCLVTKLKGTVDNDNLPKLGEIVIHYNAQESPSADTQWFNVSAGSSPVIISFSSGCYFETSYGGGTRITEPITVNAGSNLSAWFCNQDGDIKIQSKYNVSEILCGVAASYGDNKKKVNISYFSEATTLRLVMDLSKPVLGTPSLINVYLENGSDIDIENLPSTIKAIIVRDTETPINIDEIANKIKNADFSLSTFAFQSGKYTTNIVGSINSFANIALQNIGFDKCTTVTGDFESLASNYIATRNQGAADEDISYAISSTNVGGSIQAFVNACVDGGYTSGRFKCDYFKTIPNLYVDLEHTIKANDSELVLQNGYLNWNADKTWTMTES